MKTLLILAIVCILTIWLALHMRNKHELNGQIPGTDKVHSEIIDTISGVRLPDIKTSPYTYYMVLGEVPTLDSVSKVGHLFTID